eukprot:COSAG01_NODE_2317_length_7922_cov_18.384763_1_plen_76_part_00
MHSMRGWHRRSGFSFGDTMSKLRSWQVQWFGCDSLHFLRFRHGRYRFQSSNTVQDLHSRKIQYGVHDIVYSLYRR